MNNNYKNLNTQEKSDLWAEWSGSEFPSEIAEQINNINMGKNLDLEHTYGYKIMFYHFMENKPIKEIEKYFKITPFEYQVLYLTDLKS